jgi:hypothetical protein
MNLFPVSMLFPVVPKNRSFHVVPLFPPPTGGNRENRVIWVSLFWLK